MPNITNLKSGAISPTTNPYCQPQISPHKKMAICIGESIDPNSCTCPVKNGKTMANAKNMADKTKFKIKLCCVFFIGKLYSKSVYLSKDLFYNYNKCRESNNMIKLNYYR